MGAEATAGALPVGRAEPLDDAERGERAAKRFIYRFAAVQTIANVLGAIDLFVLFAVVLPTPELPADTSQGDLIRLNAILFAIVIPVATIAANVWGAFLARPVRRVLRDGGPRNAADRQAVLRQPIRVAMMDAVLWTVGGSVFAAVNWIAVSEEVGWHSASAAAMGGATTLALAYLLGERMLRPVMALVLADEPPTQPVGPGVRGRLLLAWVLATGVPLVGLACVALQVLTEGGVSATRMAGSVLALTGVAVFSGLLATALVARQLADPLTSVRRALADIKAGDLDAQVSVDDGSEVGLLQSGFNDMVAGLRDRERLRDLFGRHVGEDVARTALEEAPALGGEVRHVGVLFVDLLGSTGMAATRPPDEVVAVLNRFFSVVVDTVGRHDGWVNKFEGDGALCVFGAPVSHRDPSGAALAAGRELHHRLRRELPELDAAVGVSAGPAVAGNVGAENRFEYTVIGDPVNEAARLCDLAKRRPERMLACGGMLDGADPDEASRWQAADEVVLRGRIEPTQIAVPVGA